MNKVHTTNRRGFSLMELLVAIAIMGIVATLGGKAFSSVMMKWRETKIMTQLDNNATTVFDYIGEDLSNVLSAELSGLSIVGEDGEWLDKKEHKPSPDQADRIVIPVLQAADIANDKSKAVSVQYALVHSGQQSSLILSTSDLGANQWVQPLDIIPGVDTLAFDIQYATDTGWVNEWNESTLPKAVRVGIVVAQRDNHYYQLSRKAVYTVAVR